MIQCSQCGRALDRKYDDCFIIAISGSVMGNEYTESYFLCRDCDVYTVEIYHDRFLDEGSTSIRGPIPRTQGDEKVAIIRQCPEPWDKKCRCPAHMTYFEGSLD